MSEGLSQGTGLSEGCHRLSEGLSQGCQKVVIGLSEGCHRVIRGAIRRDLISCSVSLLCSLDPLIVHRPLSNATLTSITFAKNSKVRLGLGSLNFVPIEVITFLQVVLVGDTGGEVSVYRLSNLQATPVNQVSTCRILIGLTA